MQPLSVKLPVKYLEIVCVVRGAVVGGVVGIHCHSFDDETAPYAHSAGGVVEVDQDRPRPHDGDLDELVGAERGYLAVGCIEGDAGEPWKKRCSNQ